MTERFLLDKCIVVISVSSTSDYTKKFTFSGTLVDKDFSLADVIQTGNYLGLTDNQIRRLKDGCELFTLDIIFKIEPELKFDCDDRLKNLDVEFITDNVGESVCLMNDF